MHLVWSYWSLRRRDKYKKKNGDHKVKKRRLTAMNPRCFKNQMMSVGALHSSAPPCLGGPHVFPITAGRVNHGALIAPFFSGLHPVRPNLFTSARENLVRRDGVAAKRHISLPLRVLKGKKNKTWALNFVQAYQLFSAREPEGWGSVGEGRGVGVGWVGGQSRPSGNIESSPLEPPTLLNQWPVTTAGRSFRLVSIAAGEPTSSRDKSHPID